MDAGDLPDYYRTVAEDVLRYCEPSEGLWVDIGSGAGGVGLELARVSGSAVVLVDPNADALRRVATKADRPSVRERVFVVAGHAENLPFREDAVDLVVSRGSIFFWNDPPEGLRQAYRILRPGARAMIGGGFGTSYPEWALEEFFRRRHSELKARGKEAIQAWNEPRRPEWLAAHAQAAGLEELLLQPTPPGLWLLFEKKR